MDTVIMMEAVFVQRVLVSILTTVGSIAVPGIYTPIVHDDSSGIGSFVLPVHYINKLGP